jgi:hypothetical protein
LATGITALTYYNTGSFGGYVFAAGGHESNDQTLVFYILMYDTGELTSPPTKVDLNTEYSDVTSGARIVLSAS